MALRAIFHGAVAGAAGTAVLNTVTYLDMVVRDRPSSRVPADTAERLTDLAGVRLAEGDGGDGSHRPEGLGGLMGFLAGYGIGAAYGWLRPRLLADLPTAVAGGILALTASAATMAPYSALGASDPRRWSATGWAADIVPHLFFGLATAATFDALHR